MSEAGRTVQLARAVRSTKNLYLGLDPGLSGALALISGDDRLVLVADMPVMARGKGRVKHEVDPGGIVHLLRPHAGDIAHAVVESVSARPGQGVASMFSLGHSLGTVTALFTCLEIGFEFLSAAKWKRLAELPPDKALTLSAARRRWPRAHLTRVKDHGRAEALFMALLAMNRHAVGTNVG